MTSATGGALLVVALVIGLGAVLRRTAVLEPAGWTGIERLVYFVCFPSLLFVELARADLAGLPVLAFGGTLVATQLVMAGLASAARRLFRLPGPTYTSVLQGVVRWNSYVALALAPSLHGPLGAALAALAVAVMTPAANLLSVVALARHGRAERLGVGGTLRALLTNPLLLAPAAGVAANLAGLELPRLVAEPLRLLGQATLPLGLLAVGAALRLEAVAGRPLLLAGATLGKLLVMPAVATGIGLLAGLDGTALGMVLLVTGVPTATSSYVLARLLGGDAELMAALITATTVAAMVTLPLLLAL